MWVVCRSEERGCLRFEGLIEAVREREDWGAIKANGKEKKLESKKEVKESEGFVGLSQGEDWVGE